MSENGSCPCHPDINDAIAAHALLIEHVARSLRISRTDAGYDDAYSDGMLALWKALVAYDPVRGPLDTWLRHRIRFRMIDGLRVRTGRGARPTFVRDEDITDVQPHTTDLDTLIAAEDLIADAARVDDRLPLILGLLAAGWTRTEIGSQIGVSRTLIWRLMTLLRQRRDIAS